MGTRRTAWHYLLTLHLRAHAPRWIEVRDEVTLSAERQRVDFILTRRPGVFDLTDQGQTLDGLWTHLTVETVMEYKSPTRPYRSRDLHRLLGYGHQHFVGAGGRLSTEAELTVALMVPSRTPSLDRDLAVLGITLREVQGGVSLGSGVFPFVLVEVDRVHALHREDLIACFGRAQPLSPRALAWYQELSADRRFPMEIEKLEGYEEMFAKLVTPRTAAAYVRLASDDDRRSLLNEFPPEQRLAGLPPEQRLAGLPPEQRLAGLPPELALLALPNEALRGLSREYLDTLSAEIRAAILARLQR